MPRRRKEPNTTPPGHLKKAQRWKEKNLEYYRAYAKEYRATGAAAWSHKKSLANYERKYKAAQAWIKPERERLGLTQAELARRIGCSQCSVWRMEHGQMIAWDDEIKAAFAEREDELRKEKAHG